MKDEQDLVDGPSIDPHCPWTVAVSFQGEGEL
jgi:hypothetical protein